MTPFQTKKILIDCSDWIAVQKDAGQLVVADRFGKEKNILLHMVGEYLREHGHKPDTSGRDLYPVHRLDRDTSGIVLFAKNADSHRALSMLFEGREMQKTYWAFVAGSPAWDRCDCAIPLQRAEGKSGRGRALISYAKGKESFTEFRVKDRFGDITFLEAFPYTGRLHQIRVHSNALSHFLLGDKAYGNESWVSVDHGKLIFNRVMLHARKIEFIDPGTGKKVEIECALSEDMRELYNSLLSWKKLQKDS